MLTLTNLGHHRLPAVTCRNLALQLQVLISTSTCRCPQPAPTLLTLAALRCSLAMMLSHHQCTTTVLAANSVTLMLCLDTFWLPMSSMVKAKTPDCFSACSSSSCTIGVDANSVVRTVPGVSVNSFSHTTTTTPHTSAPLSSEHRTATATRSRSPKRLQMHANVTSQPEHAPVPGFAELPG